MGGSGTLGGIGYPQGIGQLAGSGALTAVTLAVMAVGDPVRV